MTTTTEWPKMRQTSYALAVFLLSVIAADVRPALAARCDTVQPALGRWELVDILRRGGFSGIIDEYMEINRVGNIKIEEVCFTIFVYSRGAETPPGTDFRTATRLVVIRDYTYVGMYDLFRLPLRIINYAVIFPGPKEAGNRIVFSRNGPPKEVYLHGTNRELFK